ncbi:MAG: bacteriophage holin [ANME-2 cluster archaeon]|nr:bacteriophage holin [ANME-2 cluster archaeon]
MEELNVKALSLGIGGICALYLLLLGWASMFGYGTDLVEMISPVYIGYGSTFIGSIIGALWGFVDGAIGGAIIALIYNAVVRKRS